MRQKRITVIMMASAMVFALMGCGSGSAGAISTEITQADPSFEYNGKTVSFTDDPQTVVEAIKSVAELADEVDGAESSGKTYDFDKNGENYNLSISTSADEGNEIIGSMLVNGGEFKTSKGIGIGSKAEEVEAAYGNPNERTKLKKEEIYAYKCDGYSFSFTIKGGQVKSILYSNSNFHG